jgi:hypothetical protein
MKLLVIAATVEAVWETLKMFWQEGKLNVDRIGSAILGIVLCVLAEVNFFAIVGIELSVPIVGVVLSGLLVSRGANFVHDLLKIVYEIQNQSA